MAFSLDDETVDISCPDCGRKIKQKVRWFKQGGHVCPFGCGAIFETAEFRRSLQQCEEELRRFMRDLGRL